MKGLYKLAIFILSIFSIACLASCQDDSNVSVNVTPIARNNKITLQASFKDESQGIFSEYTPYAYIYEMDGSEVGEQLESQSFSEDAEASNASSYVAEELVFDDLEKQTEYTVRITLTIDGRSYTLYDEVLMTNDIGTKENPIPITNTSEFLDMTNDREGYYVLESDLDFAGVTVEPMFTSTSRRFEGGFDGAGHTIKNITLSSNNQYNGLFSVNNGTIENLKIDNMSLKSERTSEMNTGLLVGYNTGVINNCEITNSKIEANSTAYTLTYKQNVGGLVGFVGGIKEDIAVTNCTISNITIDVDARHLANIGGLIGEVELSDSIRETQTITGNSANCNITVDQEIRAAISDDVNINVGGFVGTSASFISDCYASGKIVVNTTKSSSATYEAGLEKYSLAVGGFIGTSYDNVNRGLDKVAFFGSIEVNAKDVYDFLVAGLIADLGNNIKITNSLVYLDSLTINGPIKPADEDESTTDNVEETTSDTTGSEDGETTDVKEPNYSLIYGQIFATDVTLDYLTTNNIISCNNITPTITGTNLKEITNNSNTNVTAEIFGERIYNYYNSYIAK